LPWVEMTRFRSTEVESVSILDMLGNKSNPQDVRKLAQIFAPSEENLLESSNNEFKKPFSAKNLCQLELYLKRRVESSIPDSFENYVRRSPMQQAKNEEPCQFCQIYDENSEKMSRVQETMPVFASVVRFNSEHIAILFSDRR